MFHILASSKTSLITISSSSANILIWHIFYIYVDNIIFITSIDSLCKFIISPFRFEFFIKKNLESLSYFFWVVVTQHASGLLLSQKIYVEKVIECTSMLSCKPCPIPVDKKTKAYHQNQHSIWGLISFSQSCKCSTIPHIH